MFTAGQPVLINGKEHGFFKFELNGLAHVDVLHPLTNKMLIEKAVDIKCVQPEKEPNK